MNLAWLLVLILSFSLLGLFIGLFFIFKPELMIEIQRRFYARINWRIEPISLQKEIRNTRLMGVFLIVLCIVTMVFVLMKNPRLP